MVAFLLPTAAAVTDVLLRGLVAMLAALLLLCAALYEHISAWRDGRVLKQIGRSVDIGGRTLNIYCTGEGSPTVVFVSGRTAPGYVWTPTQRGVSAFTRDQSVSESTRKRSVEINASFASGVSGVSPLGSGSPRSFSISAIAMSRLTSASKRI